MDRDMIELIEVGPRDGLQAESQFLSIQEKVRLIQGLKKSGLHRIEVGSFVSARAVPQMAETGEVVTALGADPAWMALVPNLKGFEAAVQYGLQQIALFTSASESFAQNNINCSISESFERFMPVLEAAKDKKIFVRGYVSCIAGCPYEGRVSIKAVVEVCKVLQERGCDEISLGDTIGVGTPGQIRELLKAVGEVVPYEKIALHCHDTYGQALANIYAAIEEGIRRVDSSIAGLGGCPYAPGASGNVATEDLVYMLQGMGVVTNIHLDALLQVAHWLSDELKLPLRSKVSLAKRRVLSA